MSNAPIARHLYDGSFTILWHLLMIEKSVW